MVGAVRAFHPPLSRIPLSWPCDSAPMHCDDTEDATFFALVHSVLEAEGKRELTERRNGRRHAYRCLQRVAPMCDGELREPAEFRPVRCVDLSPHGFSYLSSELPSSRQVVVILEAEQSIWLTAEVVRHEPLTIAGRSAFRIACRFCGRVGRVNDGVCVVSDVDRR
jgi:hypothetical protein